MAMHPYNMVDMMAKGLGQELKEAVTERLIKDELKRYESKLRETVEATTEKLVFDRMESIKDILHMRDELLIYLRWDDREPKAVKGGDK